MVIFNWYNYKHISPTMTSNLPIFHHEGLVENLTSPGLNGKTFRFQSNVWTQIPLQSFSQMFCILILSDYFFLKNLGAGKNQILIQPYSLTEVISSCFDADSSIQSSIIINYIYIYPKTHWQPVSQVKEEYGTINICHFI